MSRVVQLFCSRRVPQVAVLALMSVGVAACSADTSTRFSDNPFTTRSDTTGSVRGAPYAAPAPRVERQELPQYSRPQSPSYSSSSYSSSALPPPVSAPQSYPVPSGVSGGGRGVSSYDPPSHPRLESTGTVPAPRSVAAAPAPAPAHSKGTTIIVGTSDTLEGLARRYHVSSAEILHANGYKGPRALRPGQQLVIPSRQTAQAQPPAAPAPVATPKVAAAAPAPAPAPAAGGVHYVNRGDTLMSIARRNNVPVAELARANHIAPSAPLKIGSRITIPGKKVAAAPAVMGAPPAQLGATAQPAAPAQPAPVRVAQAPSEPVQKVRLASAVETPPAAAAPSPVKAAEATGALPTFRWPVRGRVVTAYGAKTNGKANDGINVAVPEGTPVKAAEDGVVAYAGNELKGYGNLILVRHSNGYVTAYAHASELLVKRGETIKRGQTIAKSGQSGEAGSPQLHFEIRKGSTPVDPLQFLNGA